MRVLLASPWHTGARLSGDDVLTELFLAHPPADTELTHVADALRAGTVSRDNGLAAWLCSLMMHSRPPAGVPYSWDARPPLPYRLIGKISPARPDMDVLWLKAGSPPFDLVHAYMHPVHLSGELRKLPLVLGNASGNTDLLERYYNYPPDLYARWVRRDRQLMEHFDIDHDLYNTELTKFVTVPSRYAWQMHRAAGVPEAKLRLVRLGMAIAPPVRRPDPSTCRFTLVGHGFQRKGGPALLTAFRRLHRLHPEARLTLVGHVDPAELGPDLAGVNHHPALPRTEVLGRIYPETDVYVLPTLAEGYGLSVVEAMGYGLPVIASQLGALPELVKDEETGLLVMPGDVDGLFEAMKQLMEDRGLRERMGAAGRAVFEAEHAVEVTNRALAAVYAEALG